MKNNTRKILIVVDISLIVILIFLFIICYKLETPLDKKGEEKVFIIEQGQGLEKIAENLGKEEIVNSKWLFFYYLWLQNKIKNLQAGKYNLSSSMNIPEIAKKIIKGEVIYDWAKLTIPEGWTNKQIEEKLINLGLITNNQKLPEELQGYLFPDTYFFEKDSSLEEIIEKMRDNFDKRLKDNLNIEPGQAKISYPALPSSESQSDKTLYDVLIMASLLEKEVKSDEDRTIASGIFWKRLENNYPLESCATIAYILDTDKWRYSIEETKIKSPYNTYINIGLPPTPINNPGLSTIRAAIHPKYTDYNFFLTDPETGDTIFSKTLEEHNANKRRYF